MKRSTILLVEDEGGVRFGIRQFLEAHAFQVAEADSWRAAVAAFETARLDGAILDYLLPDGTALEMLPRLKALQDDVPLVILTGHGSIELAVQAVKEGADHFLTKPVELPALLVILERLLEQRRTRQRQLAAEPRSGRAPPDPFLGSTPAIRRLAQQAGKVANADVPVLLAGETGSGKGVLARWLHDHGPRRREAFVDINCAGLSPELVESELFGHEKGAFTGATATKSGLFEVAHRGTLFLDEIADVSLTVQPKLLKVLEEQRFRRLGETRDRRVDVRLIAAGHQDLGSLVRDRRFRSDLYFRINTVCLTVPPLRERAEDIPLLARQLLLRVGADMGRPSVRLSPEAEAALLAYPWPGNVRELRNVLERALLFSEGTVLERDDLRFDFATGAGELAKEPEATLAEVERRHIASVLQQEGGRVARAARRLGIPRSSLYAKLKKLGFLSSKA